VQDRLYIGTPFFGEVTIERVQFLRTVSLEMFQYLALKTTLPLIFSLIFVAVVGHEKNYLPREEQDNKDAITDAKTFQGGRRSCGTNA
jgi:hypothetical protein